MDLSFLRDEVVFATNRIYLGLEKVTLFIFQKFILLAVWLHSDLLCFGEPICHHAVGEANFGPQSPQHVFAD